MKRFLAALALSVSVACASAPPEGRPVLVPLPPPERAIAELQAALSAASAEERRAAAWALAGAGEVPPEVHETLVKLRTEDPEETVRLAAEWAIRHVKRPSASEAVASPSPAAAGERSPKLVKQTRPVYPAEAFNKKIHGMVEVEILIDERGDVAYAEVRRSIPALDAAALRTVRQWKFEPAMEAGRPVPVMAIAPVTFRIY
jgi:protein TonB